jgi:hypothetical protein
VGEANELIECWKQLGERKAVTPSSAVARVTA